MDAAKWNMLLNRVKHSKDMQVRRNKWPRSEPSLSAEYGQSVEEEEIKNVAVCEDGPTRLSPSQRSSTSILITVSTSSA